HDDWDLEGTETLELQLWTDPYNNQVELGENVSTTISILDDEVTYHDPITGMVDKHYATPNPDVFVLGDSSQTFYDSDGEQDYAEIFGFDSYQDMIQLQGSADDYYLGSSPFGNNNHKAIFFKGDGMENELVGIVKGVNHLDLNSSDFAFV
nr:hypothetical protein [Crocosphaera sp.]